jgi:hypothetical protein
VKHEQAHELAGKTVAATMQRGPKLEPLEVVLRVEDWWDLVYGASWMDVNGNPAVTFYAVRGGVSGLPIDDEVVYGKVGGMGHLVHVSELGAVQE